MTEQKTATEQKAAYVIQFDLFSGQPAAPAGLTAREQVAYILENNPDARSNDRLLMLELWIQFDHLDHALGSEALEQFRTWFQKTATHPENIRRRSAEIQKLRTEAGSLLPTAAETRRRRALDGAGPPRGRG